MALAGPALLLFFLVLSQFLIWPLAHAQFIPEAYHQGPALKIYYLAILSNMSN